MYFIIFSFWNILWILSCHILWYFENSTRREFFYCNVILLTLIKISNLLHARPFNILHCTPKIMTGVFFWRWFLFLLTTQTRYFTRTRSDGWFLKHKALPFVFYLSLTDINRKSYHLLKVKCFLFFFGNDCT